MTKLGRSPKSAYNNYINYNNMSKTSNQILSNSQSKSFLNYDYSKEKINDIYRSTRNNNYDSEEINNKGKIATFNLKPFNLVDLTKASTEYLMQQIYDLQLQVKGLKEQNSELNNRLSSITMKDKVKDRLNYLEDEVDEINFSDKCISTVKELSEIMVIF